MPRPALIALEDGACFTGEALSGSGTVGGELVFTTAMADFQEAVTDPSHHGQLLVYTFPLIGNYGVHPDRDESGGAHARAVIAREITNYCFNHASSGTWLDWLAERNVLAVSGVDTRALTRHLRDQGTQRAVVTTEQAEPRRLRQLARKLPSPTGQDLVKAVSCAAPETYVAEHAAGEGQTAAPHVIAFDFGIRRSVLGGLLGAGFRVTLVPAKTSAREVLRLAPEAVFLSDGPGDPAAVGYAVKAVSRLLGAFPILGVGLGHQVLALALGLPTYRLKCGHRGANCPVKELGTERIETTTQNHGFAVRAQGRLPDGVEITHVNLHDGTVEGLSAPSLNAFSIQYHPQAPPQLHGTHRVFSRLRELVETPPAAAGR